MWVSYRGYENKEARKGKKKRELEKKSGYCAVCYTRGGGNSGEKRPSGASSPRKLGPYSLESVEWKNLTGDQV